MESQIDYESLVPTPASPGACEPMAASADFQLVVTVLVFVKNCTPALPYLQAQ